MIALPRSMFEEDVAPEMWLVESKLAFYDLISHKVLLFLYILFLNFCSPAYEIDCMRNVQRIRRVNNIMLVTVSPTKTSEQNREVLASVHGFKWSTQYQRW